MLWVGLLVACLASAAVADVKLPGVFGNHMVLQRELSVPVWGWASPGEKVTVELAGQTKSATADAQGKWSVKLDALQAGGPHVLTVTSGNTVKIDDVLVGEVWLGSGQSNMAMSVAGSKDFPQEKAAANFPKIRMFTVARKTADSPQDDCAGKWEVCSPHTVGGFSAAAYFFGRELHKTLEVPVGLINSSWGGTPVQAWTSLPVQEAAPELGPMLAAWKKNIAGYDPEAAKARFEKQLARWKEQAAQAKRDGKPAPRKPNPPVDPKVAPHRPASLFNGMIAPLVPYALRGAIWYQGESNAGGDAKLYGLQLRAMITDWRTRWQEGDFPFLTVQLPNFHRPQQQPVEPSGWVTVREEMLKTLSLKNAGMAITIDVGDAADIHPKNKQEVGRRLALWALAHTYGKDVVGSGPIYKSMEKKDGRIVLHFDYVGGGLTAAGGGALKGFAIAGTDKKFVRAEAKIEGQTVVVSSPEVKDPAAVRYAWADNPDCNLANQAGLPASPFRTDEDPALVPVQGKVSLEGKPLAGATVVFQSEQGGVSQAVTDGQGRYELVYEGGGKGAVPGKSRVVIRSPARAPKLVPERYSDPAKTGLMVEINPGQNEFDFGLQR
jgi:sialate O-acetylesterase